MNTELKNLCRAILYTTILTSAVSAHALDYGSYQDLFGEPVTTSATGKPQRVSDVPINMEIITADDIARSGASDVPTILRGVAGMHVEQTNMLGTEVAIRGFKQAYQNRVLVLVDGRQVYTDIYGYTNWAEMPVQLPEIRQIEIVKGPNTALFGFNAVSGVINIVTFNPLYDSVNNITTTYGSQKLRSGAGVVTGRIQDKMGLRISGLRQLSREFKSKTASASEDAFRQGQKPTMKNYRIDYGYKLGDNTEARLEIAESYTNQHTTFPSYNLARSNFTFRAKKVSLSSDTPFGLWNTNAYENKVRQKSNPIGFKGTGWLLNSVRVVNISDSFKIGASHAFRLFGETRVNKQNHVNSTGNIRYKVYAASASWDWDVTSKINLINSVRFDKMKLGRNGGFIGETLYGYEAVAAGLAPASTVNAALAGIPAIPVPSFPFIAAPYHAAHALDNSMYNRRFKEHSINSGFVWKPTETDTIRGAYARGADLPSMIEFDSEVIDTAGADVANAVNCELTDIVTTALSGGQIPQTSCANQTWIKTLFSGNPFLKPSIVQNYEVSYDKKLTSNIDVRGTVFYQTSKNLQIVPDLFYVPLTDPSSDAAKYVWKSVKNAADAKLYGTELGFKGTYNDKYRYGANLTLLKSTFKWKKDVPEYSFMAANGGKPFFMLDIDKSTPKYTLNTNLGYTWNQKVNFDLYANYVAAYHQSSRHPTTLQASLQKVPAQLILSGRVAYDINKFFNVSLNSIGFNKKTSQQNAIAKAERMTFVSLSLKF